jgi:coatomer subunit gamma
MAQGVERFFKAAIVDRNPSISSAALVSSYHLFPAAKDVVKRWVNEAQEAVSAKSTSSFFNASPTSGYLGFGSTGSTSTTQTVPSTSYITQYHALGLLYLIRQQDRMAVTKMIQQLGGGKSGAGTTLKNPMALCMLIRYAAKAMEDDPKYVIPNTTNRSQAKYFTVACKSKCLSCWRAGYGIKVTWSTLRRRGLSVK